MFYQTNEMSYREVANALGIDNFPLTPNWVRKFLGDSIKESEK
ncbi:hypothetical protein [Vagococcus carniphilus]|nr:hypothetical protein [Vagococcus carniphilus]